METDVELQESNAACNCFGSNNKKTDQTSTTISTIWPAKNNLSQGFSAALESVLKDSNGLGHRLRLVSFRLE